MILTTKGIVLHSMDYSETSLIARVFTEQLGLQSYIAKGIRRKGSSTRKNIFTPLTVIQIVANHKEGEGLRVVREASVVHPNNGIAADMNKLAVSIFMSELLTRTITAQLPDKNLFHLIESAIRHLESTRQPVGSFPLWFSIRLAQHMGFGPRNNFSSQNNCFDLEDGMFCPPVPSHPYYIIAPLSIAFAETLTGIESGVVDLQLYYPERNGLLNCMVDYFRLHVSGFGEMKSVQVLSEVLRD